MEPRKSKKTARPEKFEPEKNNIIYKNVHLKNKCENRRSRDNSSHTLSHIRQNHLNVTMTLEKIVEEKSECMKMGMPNIMQRIHI